MIAQKTTLNLTPELCEGFETIKEYFGLKGNIEALEKAVQTLKYQIELEKTQKSFEIASNSKEYQKAINDISDFVGELDD